MEQTVQRAQDDGPRAQDGGIRTRKRAKTPGWLPT
jgi:hypothetical protein